MQKYKTSSVSINGKRLNALLADTFTKRLIGLMFRNGLKPGACMLFTFPYPDFHGIWMRNMRFSIDVLWINDKGIVVDISENLPPCESLSGCRTYYPGLPSKYIIELNSGSSKRFKIRKGTKVLLNPRPRTSSSRLSS